MGKLSSLGIWSKWYIGHFWCKPDQIKTYCAPLTYQALWGHNGEFFKNSLPSEHSQFSGEHRKANNQL